MNKKGITGAKKAILFFILVSVLGGVIFKIGNKDCGITRLSRIEELQDYDIVLNYAWQDSDAAGVTKDSFGDDYYGVGSAGVVALVSPTGMFIQTEGSIGQEFTVDQVLKGKDQIVEDENYYVYEYFGFYPVDGSIEFRGNMNLMIPGNQYLIFMDASPLNEYQKEDVFLLASDFFGYIRVDAAPTKTLNEDYRAYNFAELGGYEFFSVSDAATNSLNAVREEILRKYL